MNVWNDIMRKRTFRYSDEFNFCYPSSIEHGPMLKSSLASQ